jgi:hypothetical protein
MDTIEVIDDNAREGDWKRPDVAIVGEINPDLIFYSFTLLLPSEIRNNGGHFANGGYDS